MLLVGGSRRGRGALFLFIDSASSDLEWFLQKWKGCSLLAPQLRHPYRLTSFLDIIQNYDVTKVAGKKSQQNNAKSIPQSG